MADAEVSSRIYGKEGETLVPINPQTTALQVRINDETGTPSNVEAEIIAIRRVIGALEGGGAAFKGTVNSSKGLPTVAYKAGWQYVVEEAGTYAGQVCEVGEFIFCVRDYASGSASNSDWTVLQVNVTGAVSGPANSVVGHVAVFDATTGKKIKDSGLTIGTSVPADAKFTDTTYAPATAQADGLMTAALYSKLVAIEAGADKTDAENVAASGAFMTATNTADNIKDGSSKVVMTSTERTKLSGVATGAEVNQNAFSSVKVGSATMSASAKTDTFEIAAGEGVTLSASGKKVTIAETYIDSCVVTSLDNVPANLRNGGLVILKQ